MKFNCAYTEIVELHKLQPNPKNPNTHPDRQIELLAKIIDYQGQRSPIVVSKRSGFITKGHGRLMAIQKLGWEKAAVDYQDYDSEAQEYADIVADNKISELAKHDDSKMIEDLKLIDLDDFELLGMDDFELPTEIDLAKEEIEDDVPTNVETRCKEGDLWILGEHRLLCGDSTNIQHVERLMGGEKADMVFTDPPYGVDYDGGVQKKRNKLSNDQRGTSIYSDVLPLLKALTQDNASFYIWHAAGYADMAQTLWDNGFEIRSQIIWNKNQAQFGALSAQYKQKHEPCFYCFKKGNKPNWSGPTNEVTVWDLVREKKNEFHPTQKPVELAERAIKNHKAPKILDLFGGSGSTLIACEKTNRKCFMMELDPHYCDVIITRWEKYSGKPAKLEAAGEGVGHVDNG